MPAVRKNFEAAVSMYNSGASIEEVADAHNMSRQSMWKILQRRAVQMRAAVPAPALMVDGVKYSLREHGYFAETKGRRSYLHRDVWEKHNGPIPEGFEIHHRDENKANNDIANLEMLTCSEHGARHGFGGNQHVPSLGRRPIK